MEEDVLSENLRHSLVRRLRELEPYMQIEAINDLVFNCERLLGDGIKEQHAIHISNLRQALISNIYRRPIIETSKARTSFFSLSTELRNRIYELVLIPEEGEKTGTKGTRGFNASPPIPIGFEDKRVVQKRARRRIRICSNCSQGQLTKPNRVPWELQPPLTKVCRAIRSETLPIYYGSNEFVLDPFQSSNRAAGREVEFPYTLAWLRAIGPENIKLLKCLTLKEYGRPDLWDSRFVSAGRFVALMEQQGIHLPKNAVTCYYYDTDHAASVDFGEPAGQIFLIQPIWSKLKPEMEARYSNFGNEPGLWNDVIGMMPGYFPND